MAGARAAAAVLREAGAGVTTTNEAHRDEQAAARFLGVEKWDDFGWSTAADELDSRDKSLPESSSSGELRARAASGPPDGGDHSTLPGTQRAIPPRPILFLNQVAGDPGA